MTRIFRPARSPIAATRAAVPSSLSSTNRTSSVIPSNAASMRRISGPTLPASLRVGTTIVSSGGTEPPLRRRLHVERFDAQALGTRGGNATAGGGAPWVRSFNGTFPLSISERSAPHDCGGDARMRRKHGANEPETCSDRTEFRPFNAVLTTDETPPKLRSPTVARCRRHRTRAGARQVRRNDPPAPLRPRGRLVLPARRAGIATRRLMMRRWRDS
jgi:hypothetical protein